MDSAARTRRRRCSSLRSRGAGGGAASNVDGAATDEADAGWRVCIEQSAASIHKHNIRRRRTQLTAAPLAVAEALLPNELEAGGAEELVIHQLAAGHAQPQRDPQALTTASSSSSRRARRSCAGTVPAGSWSCSCRWACSTRARRCSGHSTHWQGTGCSTGCSAGRSAGRSASWSARTYVWRSDGSAERKWVGSNCLRQ